jgi:hypothetical protein
MSSGITAVIVVVAIVVIVAVVAMTMAARRRRLQQNFGPEYDRAVAEKDSRKQAEAELAERQRRVRKYDIRPLSLEARSRYLGEWQAIQEQFVDSPQTAVTEAYALVTTVMQDRGYPPVEDDQVADDLSVDHADTVGHFRSAQAITREAAHGSVATEDLRQAFIHYRELFADLLSDTEDADGQPIDPATTTGGTTAGGGRHAAPQADLDEADLSTGRPYPADAEPAGTDPDGVPVTATYMESDGYRRR